MLITDLLEDIYRFGNGNEIEFHLVDKDGHSKRLDLFITTGRYLYKKEEYNDEENNEIVILGLEDPDAKT